MKSKKSTALKIGVLVLLVCVVAGIGIFKNTKKAEIPADLFSSSSSHPGEAVASKNSFDAISKAESSEKKAESNPDFTLLVTEKLDLEKLKSYGIPIVIDFGSDSCQACQEMASVLEELNQELRGKAIVKFVDVWKYQNLAQGYPITVIPTQVFFDAKGNPYTPKDAKAMQLNLYSSKDTNKHIFTTHEGVITKEQLLAMLKEMGMKE
nr:thioredoxin family protein [uncultured Caproiciproducens sp.]